MYGFDGLQDLFAQSQGGAHGEGSPRLTPPQVGQVPTLRRQQRGNMFDKEHRYLGVNVLHSFPQTKTDALIEK